MCSAYAVGDTTNSTGRQLAFVCEGVMSAMRKVGFRLLKSDECDEEMRAAADGNTCTWSVQKQ